MNVTEGIDALDPILTVEQAAKLMSVSTKTIYRAIEARTIRFARLGQSKCYRIRLSWLYEWIDRSAEDVLPISEFEITGTKAPPRTANRGPYAREKTPRRGTLK